MSRSVWTRLRECAETLPVFTIIPASLLPIVKKMVKPFAQDRPTATELLALTKSKLRFHAARPPVKEPKAIVQRMETE